MLRRKLIGVFQSLLRLRLEYLMCKLSPSSSSFVVSLSSPGRASRDSFHLLHHPHFQHLIRSNWWMLQPRVNLFREINKDYTFLLIDFLVTRRAEGGERRRKHIYDDENLKINWKHIFAKPIIARSRARVSPKRSATRQREKRWAKKNEN